MDNPTKLVEQVAKAEDLSDLLNHIAWTDVVLPRLQQEKERYTQLLVRSVLGSPIIREDGVELTREQLAGKVEGVQFIIKLMEDIIRQGDRALRQLNSHGYNLD